MKRRAMELARRLAGQAETVCRHYLPNGRRGGGYWLVGDVRNAPGRSMFVRLNGPDAGKGAAGNWTDAATGEHGDLLDIIRESCGLADFSDVAAEAERFLGCAARSEPTRAVVLARSGSSASAHRLFVMSRPIAGTIAEAYLRRRGITDLHGTASLRFHPRCFYRPDEYQPLEIWPALIAAVTDMSGRITGAHRTWLDPAGRGKAPVETPRRAMGELLGHAVRFGGTGEAMAAGEGIETVLSLRSALTAMPMMAALSAAHLAAILFPTSLRRLYIARDDDPAGDRAIEALSNRSLAAGIEPVVLMPRLGDFNEDLRAFGADALRAALRPQIAPGDVAAFSVRRSRIGRSERFGFRV